MLSKVQCAFAAAILVIFPVSLDAQSANDIKHLLASWSPASVEIENGVATVILPQRLVTDAMYYPAIAAGFCLGPLLGRQLNDVDELQLLNSFGAQGWVFENSEGVCGQIVNEPASRVNAPIAAHSHLY